MKARFPSIFCNIFSNVNMHRIMLIVIIANKNHNEHHNKVNKLWSSFDSIKHYGVFCNIVLWKYFLYLKFFLFKLLHWWHLIRLISMLLIKWVFCKDLKPSGFCCKFGEIWCVFMLILETQNRKKKGNINGFLLLMVFVIFWIFVLIVILIFFSWIY